VCEGRKMQTPTLPAKQPENSQADIDSMSSTLGFNIATSIKHTTIYIPGYAHALQIKMHDMQYIQK